MKLHMRLINWSIRVIAMGALVALGAAALTSLTGCYPKCHYDPQYHRSMPIPCEP